MPATLSPTKLRSRIDGIDRQLDRIYGSRLTDCKRAIAAGHAEQADLDALYAEARRLTARRDQLDAELETLDA